MSPISDFVERCDAVAARLRIKRSTLSTHLFKDGKRLDQLAKGSSDVGVMRLQEAERTLASLESQATASPA